MERKVQWTLFWLKMEINVSIIQTVFQTGADKEHVTETYKMVVLVLFMMTAKICYALEKNVESYLISFHNLITTMLLDKMEINVNFLKIAPPDIVFNVIAMEI